MRLFPVPLSVLLLLVSCASVPPALQDAALPTDLGAPETGRFVYHESRAGLFAFSQTPEVEVLEASISRRASLLALADDRTLVLSVSWQRSPPVSFQWECLYRVTSVDRYESRGSYILRPLRLPPDWEFPAFDTDRLDTLLTLPTAVIEGQWRGRPVKVLATRLLGAASQEAAENGWKSFVSEYQRFQIVDERGRVLAETSGKEGSLVREHEYRVYDSVPRESVASMVAGLAIVAALPRFLAAVDEYRRAESAGKAWPLFD